MHGRRGPRKLCWRRNEGYPVFDVESGEVPAFIVPVSGSANKVSVNKVSDAAGSGGVSGATSGGALLVLTTCGGAADAQRIAAALVERRLAACVNTLNGVSSTYRWQGRVVHDEESLLLIKTTAERYPALEAAIRELSGYELPEVVAVRVDGGLPPYLDWLAESVARGSE